MKCTTMAIGKETGKEIEKDLETLQFKPVTEGLGFHPFSNGLPYTPNLRKSPLSGPDAPSGATVAGPPRFVPPPPRGPIPRHQPMAMGTSVAGLAAKAAAQLQRPLQVEQAYGFLYVMKRLCAFFMDVLFNLAVAAVAVTFSLSGGTDLSQGITDDVIIIGTLLFIVFHWLLVVAQELVFKTSFGKKLFRLSLQGSAGAILLRALAFPVSVLFFGLGIVWAVFDSKRRCWHDIAARLQPSEIARIALS